MGLHVEISLVTLRLWIYSVHGFRNRAKIVTQFYTLQSLLWADNSQSDFWPHKYNTVSEIASFDDLYQMSFEKALIYGIMFSSVFVGRSSALKILRERNSYSYM